MTAAELARVAAEAMRDAWAIETDGYEVNEDQQKEAALWRCSRSKSPRSAV